MKTLLLIFLISAFSMHVKAQRTIPQKGDNLIIIVGNKSPHNNYLSFGKYLISKGFYFISSNPDFLTLKTDNVVARGQLKYNLEITFNDSLILIRPKCNYLYFMPRRVGWTDWHYLKAKTQYFNIVYQAFIPILKGYNGKVFFKHN